MKRSILILICFLLATPCFSQRFIGSVIAGANVTQVDGDEVYGFRKFGANVGGSAMIALNEKQTWFATVELLFTQKGSYQKAYVPNMDSIANANYNYPYNPKIKYKLNLDYVEVPVVFHYEDPRTGWALGAGLSWARMVTAKEIENGWHTTTGLRSGTYRRCDWSVLADLKIRLWKGLKLNVRYQYSFVPLRSRTFYINQPKERLRKQYNNVISVRLIYSFNEKYVPNNKYMKNNKPTTRWMRDTSPFAK